MKSKYAHSFYITNLYFLWNKVSPQENNGCDKVGYQTLDGGQNCYKLFSGLRKTWNSASDYCKLDGGNLASVRDGFEQAYLSLLKTSSINNEWIGLKSVRQMKHINRIFYDLNNYKF